ncbi:MAG: hypothetical protein ACKOBM_01310, partial [Gammaproteobacteria bacterium]
MRKQVNRLMLAGGAVLLLATGWPMEVRAADAVCYQNDQGRIVPRRRPGYKPVPCPRAEGQSQAEAQSGAAADGADAGESAAPVSNAATRRRIPQQEWARRSPAMADRQPNPASVVPR